jgi:hypothetical protein
MDELGTIGSAPVEPASPLVCSIGSLTADSPEKVDHLVTFIACQIVTEAGLTEILGTRSAADAAPAYAALRQTAGIAKPSDFVGRCAVTFPD